MTKRQRCLLASKHPEVALSEEAPVVENPDPAPVQEEESLLSVLKCFRSSPFGASSPQADGVVDEWLRSSVPGQGHRFLLTLVQRLSNHLRSKHPFLEGNGRVVVNVHSLVQVMKLALVGSRLVVFDSLQQKVFQTAEDFCSHLRKLAELIASRLESNVELPLTGDDFETEITFEYSLHAAVTHFEHWRPTFVAVLARKYENKVVSMLDKINLLRAEHPRFLLFAMDDFAGVLESAKIHVSAERLSALVSDGVRWAQQVVDPVTFASLEKDKNQFKALFSHDLKLELIHEFQINPEWTLHANSCFHPYVSSLKGPDVCCQYRSILMEPPSEEQWACLLDELAVSPFLGEGSSCVLGTVLSDISYFALRVMWHQGGEGWRRGSERRWLVDLLDPDRIRGHMLACDVSFTRDLWAKFAQRTFVPGSESAERTRALGLLVGRAEGLSSVDRGGIATFVVRFLQGFFELVAAANRSMLSEISTWVVKAGKAAQKGLPEVLEQYVGKRFASAYYKRPADDISSLPRRVDVSIVSSFFVRTQESIRAAVARLPFSEAMLLVARSPLQGLLLDAGGRGSEGALHASFEEFSRDLLFLRPAAGPCHARAHLHPRRGRVGEVSGSDGDGGVLGCHHAPRGVLDGGEPARGSRGGTCNRVPEGVRERDPLHADLCEQRGARPGASVSSLGQCVGRVPHGSDPSGAHARDGPRVLPVEAHPELHPDPPLGPQGDQPPVRAVRLCHGAGGGDQGDPLKTVGIRPARDGALIYNASEHCRHFVCHAVLAVLVM